MQPGAQVPGIRTPLRRVEAIPFRVPLTEGVPMRTVSVRAPLLTALAVALVVASPAWAQKLKKADTSQPPEVYRMEIFNGSMRTVHYITPSYMSPSEAATLKEIERTENELALNDQLFALRAQYAVNEQALEAKRRAMQELLYGYNRDESSSYLVGAAGPGVAGIGGFGFPGMAASAYPWNGWYGNSYAAVTSSGDTTHSLSVGAGLNEGVIKNELAKYLATPAMSEQAAVAARAHKAALAQLDKYPRLLAGLGLEGVEGTKASFTTTEDVVYLKDGNSISGKIISEDKDWMTIEVTAGKAKRTEKVRMTEVTRVSRAAGGEKPAIDK